MQIVLNISGLFLRRNVSISSYRSKIILFRFRTIKYGVVKKIPGLESQSRGFDISKKYLYLDETVYRTSSIFLVFTNFPSTISV